MSIPLFAYGENMYNNNILTQRNIYNNIDCVRIIENERRKIVFGFYLT